MKMDKQCYYGSDMERDIHTALTNAGIRAVHESQGDTSKLDFLLPDYGVYIEVKAFHADRISRQMASQPNIIAVQGKSAVSFLISLLNDRTNTKKGSNQNEEIKTGN